MHYVLGDVHNDIRKLNSILEQINISRDDELIILGDLFDRGGETADPVAIYFALSRIQGNCTWIRGNHDKWLAEYIYDYFSKSEKAKKNAPPYHYNTFELMKSRLTERDMLDIADIIMRLPLQCMLTVGDKQYLMAHAMTADPQINEDEDYYLMGNDRIDDFFKNGIKGYISLVGHTQANYMHCRRNVANDIWINEKGNVILMDCGCGHGGGRLACMCLETGAVFYSG